MKTYNDLLNVGEEEQKRMEFCEALINEHKMSYLYKTASDAELYYRHLNPTIMRIERFIYNVQGKAVPDIYRANNKIPCRYYFYFVTQSVQYLLGNGVSFGKSDTKDRLGKDFDNDVVTAAVRAINGGVSFGFWNFDHLEIMAISDGSDVPCFVPLYDEETGALRAGVRFWQIAENKPLRYTLFEEDGYTEYIRRIGKTSEVYSEKKAYVQIREQSEASGEAFVNGQNYSTLPIVPLFNINKQSEIVGNREVIDAYDLMASDLVNNVDDANFIYWIIKNAGGMEDDDLEQFIERIKMNHVAEVNADAGVDVEAHSIETPYAASETALNRLRDQLFDDFMALDTKNIAGGATTATQIMAAYEPLNAKTDMLEYQVTEFINGILALLGIDDKPSYTRSKIVNTQEEIQTLLMAQANLSDEYVTRKVLELMGDIDKVDEVMAARMGEDLDRFNDDAEDDLNE